jgi:2-keto-3-deoxy-6-phosphogluconate aldolase
LTRAEARTRIEEVGIIPAVRVSTPEQAQFAAEALNGADIPIAGITMTVPHAIDVISISPGAFLTWWSAQGRFWIPEPQAAVWTPAQSF